jgi:hypothetical protein
MLALRHFRTGDYLMNIDGSVKTFDVLPVEYEKLVELEIYTVEDTECLPF